MPSTPPSKHRPWRIPKETTEQQRWAKDRDPLYDSPAWRAARKVCLDEEPICIFCKSETTIQPSTVGDHRIPIRFGGAALHRSNHQGMCESCHNSKSRYESKHSTLADLRAWFMQGGVGVKNFWGF